MRILCEQVQMNLRTIGIHDTLGGGTNIGLITCHQQKVVCRGRSVIIGSLVVGDGKNRIALFTVGTNQRVRLKRAVRQGAVAVKVGFILWDRSGNQFHIYAPLLCMSLTRQMFFRKIIENYGERWNRLAGRTPVIHGKSAEKTWLYEHRRIGGSV